MLGKDNAENRRIADALTQSLNAIFNKYDVVNLDALKEARQAAGKAILEKLLPSSRFVINYIVLTAFDGHAIPLTPRMLEYLKNNELVQPEADYRGDRRISGKADSRFAGI